MIDVALRQRFPDLEVDIAFTAPTPGTIALFGPSGSGKSTTVAVIAGLLRPDQARITIGDAVLADTALRIWLPPERRRLGVVFQDARLFPHLGVRANLLYGSRRAIGGTIRFDDVVCLLGIAPLLDRRPHTLSGGERQRVAIGRALLSQPRLLLMDEPLASLDAARKDEILPYLVRLRRELALPIVYVTHSLDEVVRLADTLVLLDAGRVVASGPLTEVLSRSHLSLAARDDAGAVLDAEVVRHHPDRRLTELITGGIALLVPLLSASPGIALRVRVPAREVMLAKKAPPEISVQNAIPGHVRAVTEDAARHAALVEVAIGGVVVLARVTPDAVARLGLVPGMPVVALMKSVGLEVLNAP